MDIGFANSLKFKNDEISEQEAKNLFVLSKMLVKVGKEEKEVDLSKELILTVQSKKEEGLIYNGKIIARLKENSKDRPYNLENYVPRADNSVSTTPVTPSGCSGENERPDEMISAEERKNSKGTYELNEKAENYLYVQFADKIRVFLEYIVVVPVEDNSYTKRLRYPVKYYNLDYKLEENVQFTLAGQIMGTLIDQGDVATDIDKKKKRISLKTRNWLLPKNGVVIVHCNA